MGSLIRTCDRSASPARTHNALQPIVQLIVFLLSGAWAEPCIGIQRIASFFNYRTFHDFLMRPPISPHTSPWRREDRGSQSNTLRGLHCVPTAVSTETPFTQVVSVYLRRVLPWTDTVTLTSFPSLLDFPESAFGFLNLSQVLSCYPDVQYSRQTSRIAVAPKICQWQYTLLI